MKILTFFLKFVLISLCSASSAASKKASYTQCVQASDHYNSMFPITVSEIPGNSKMTVVLYSSYCTKIGSTASLHYLFDIGYSNVPFYSEESLRDYKNDICTDEQTKFLLENLDSLYFRYMSFNGALKGVIKVSESDCE